MPDALLKTAAARKPLAELEQHDAFLERHIGPDSDEQAQMLSLLGYATRAALIDAVVPAGIRSKTALERKQREKSLPGEHRAVPASGADYAPRFFTARCAVFFEGLFAPACHGQIGRFKQSVRGFAHRRHYDNGLLGNPGTHNASQSLNRGGRFHACTAEFHDDHGLRAIPRSASTRRSILPRLPLHESCCARGRQTSSQKSSRVAGVP